MSEDESQSQGTAAIAAIAAIAIIGMAGRFPGAPTLERFWENLRDGVESVSFFTVEELLAAGVDAALLADPNYVRARAVFDGIADFDAAFFGFTPREAEVLDPQHRVLLECAWEALEDAGQDPGRVGARAAVYAGSGTSSYLFSNLMPNAGLLAAVGGLQALLLNDRDFLATRLSYKLNLKGPSVLVQTACSTGLTAVHMASQSLLSGECDLALAGAVSIAVPEKEGYLYQEGAITSPDGHCRAFDASSGGAVVGNGCGVVVLKRLADAVADGDPIYAVLRGSAVNNDGSAKVGFTAPSVEGQADVITESLLMAGVEPASIAYVEGHGSGTALGDPIEVAALVQAFAAAGGTDSCALGSVKTNVGHLNTAAGLAGLIKTALALEHATIPPSLHFERPNPQAGFGPFRVPVRAEPWPADRSPRRAGVSSFGLGGTNVHAVLEEAPPLAAGGPSRPVQLLTVSARTEAALDAACRRLADRLETEALDLADVAFTLQTGRKAFAWRRAVVARDRVEAVAALREGRGARGNFEGSERPVVFLFPGLGDQAPGMGKELYATEPVFAAEIDRCSEILGIDLREVLFAGAPQALAEPDLRALLRRNAAPLDEAGQRLARTENAQPAVFAVEYALARLLMSWGVKPRAMIGYSLGEYVAATLAGVLSLEDALGLVARRAKLIQELPGGAMLALPLPEAEVAPLLAGGELSLAATNGPHFCVVAGPEAAVGELETVLSGRGVASIRLATTHAFHSRMMAPAGPPLTGIARALPAGPPRIPYVSNVTGSWIAAADLADPGYWARHMTQPVRFAEGLAELLREPEQMALEVGPGGTLTALVHQIPAAAGTAAATTLGRAGEGGEQAGLLGALGRLWAAGGRFDSAAFFAGERRRKVRLPTYPFERQRYWIDPPAPGTAQAMEAAPRDVADWFWTPSWQQVPLAAGSSGEDGGWLIFLDETGLGERLAERLRGEGRVVATARRAADLDYAALLQGASNVVHLWGVTAGEPAPREALEAGLLSLVRLSQAVTSPVHVTVVANGLHEVADGDPVHPAKATVLGVLKVLHQEVPSLSCACVDVGQPSDRRVDQILAEARRGAAAGGSVVALRGRQRWVRDFAPVSLPDHAPVAPGGAYLVTDGQHGAALADYLVNQLAARVAMAGEARPGVVSLPPGEPAAVLAAARAALGTIDGVFHTGGAFTGGLVQLKTAESLLASIEPATRDAEAWLAAADALTERPGFVLLMSSTLAFTGGLGQLDLAVTGAFLDALAQRQAAGGRTRTLAVHWDPYQWKGWLVAAAGGLAGLQPEEVEKSLDAWGTPSEKSGDALLRLLASGLPRAVVSSREIHGLIAEADAVTAETFLAQVGTLHGNSVGAGGEKAARPALSTPYVAPRNEREATLAALWEELFGIASVGVDDSFLELGGHSLLAIQMVTQIRNRLAADLPVTALFESPTVAELAKAVGRAKGEESEEDLAALLALVEGLSPEEAAERLAALEVSSWVPPPVPRVTSPSAAGDWPLSIDQERLWRLHRDNPALVSWNVDAASRLRGDLDASLLAAALREVVRRHAALRASFPLVDGRPVQRVAAEMAASLGLIDLKALPEGAREGEAHRALFDRTRQVFDLEHGPLVRAALVRLDPRDHLFLLTLHHTATDWITIQLVMQELMALYEVARAGLPSPLSEPERQFPDFAVWERRWWSGGVLAESADFWRRELAGFPLVLDLPADRPRPAVQSQRGGMIPFSAGPEGSRRLRDLARREAVTPFMANLALVDALLFRLTGRDKLVVGSNSANRPRPELEAVAGFFLTQVPFAVDLAGDPTFRELLARVKKASLAAYSRPSMPFDRLIEAVAPEAAADSSRFPLVQVLLLVLEGKSHVDAGSLGSTAVPLYDGNSRWDLLFGFYNYEDLGLTGSVEYNADILDGTTVESWLRLLRRILEKVTADPGTRLSQLPGVDTEGPA